MARVVAAMCEAGLGCVLATQGLADLARVDRVLPQRVMQDTAIKLVLRPGSDDDAELWARTIGHGHGMLALEPVLLAPPGGQLP